MTEPQPIKIQRRTPAEQLRYLASKLNEGDISPLSIAIALEVTANELDAELAEAVAAERERCAQLARQQAEITVIAKAIAALPCVQAGWAFGVPEDGQADWLHMVTFAALEAVAYLLRNPPEEESHVP